jgi:hypothetical protein
MNKEQEGPPDLQRVSKELEAANEAATRMELGKAVPDSGKERDIKDLDEIRKHTDAALAALANWQHGQHSATKIVKALEKSTATLVSAMNANAEALGGALSDQTATAFEADAAVLAEGEFLKEQLTGVEGTEGRGPLFKRASIAVGASGFEVLADAVNDASPRTPRGRRRRPH